MIQEKIADELGLSLQGYRMKEWGKSKFTIEEMVRLVELFDLSYPEMCGIFFDGKLLHENLNRDEHFNCEDCMYRFITNTVLSRQDMQLQAFKGASV